MSTVQISLRDILGVAVSCHVIFKPEDTPFTNGPALTVSKACSVLLDGSGTGQATLQPGRYAVRFLGISGNSDLLAITVPGDNATYNLTALIGSGAGIVTPAPDYVRNADVTAPGRAMLTAASPQAQRGALGLGSAALLNAPANGNAAAGELVKGDDTRLAGNAPEIWNLFEKHYFPYENTPGTGEALLRSLMAQSRGPHPAFAVHPSLAAMTTAVHGYPRFGIMWADNFDVFLLLTPPGDPVPCICGLATWMGDFELGGLITPTSVGYMDYYFQNALPAGDLNGDGICDGADVDVFNELANA